MKKNRIISLSKKNLTTKKIVKAVLMLFLLMIFNVVSSSIYLNIDEKIASESGEYNNEINELKIVPTLDSNQVVYDYLNNTISSQVGKYYKLRAEHGGSKISIIIKSPISDNKNNLG
ncbi:hypothetical protein [Enterobacter hormaechei]|uniref:hypothetical protein n=1 Tax=Enterobacter hormaechei TaxID=158836 RepID=UPI0005E94532|nr:hypothetical protein [Enterobacter hormaechei]KJI83179.1 hypothetical protein UP05_23875 [Enterobacter hormaechei]